MIKAIKFDATGTASRSRRRGKFLLGEHGKSYGPTETTGFYNTIEPPEGGYTLYLKKETEGPAIYVFNNATELLDFCNNNLGANQTTIFGVIDWINEQEEVVVDPNYFHMSVEFTNNSTFAIPFVQDVPVDFVVDWGDGTTDTITTYNQAETTHEFPALVSTTSTGTEFTGVYASAYEISSQYSEYIEIYGGNDPMPEFTVGMNITLITDVPDLSFEIRVTGILNDYPDYKYFRAVWTNPPYPGAQEYLYYYWIETIIVGGGTVTEPATYDIKIAGKIKGLQFTNDGRSINIKKWGCLEISENSMFNGCTKLVSDAVDAPKITTTDLSNTFRNCFLFNGNIGNWDVSGVTDMSNMFYLARVFNQDISSWDMSSVINTSSMFYDIYYFNQPLDEWNVSSVTDMSLMFFGARDFNQPLNSWNVSSVTNMESMFRSAFDFNQPLDNWNVSSVTDMSRMFENIDFNGNIGSWDTSNVTTMASMFKYTSFNQPLDNWNVSSVTDMAEMFYGTNAFNQSLNSWNVSGVTNMFGMFKGTEVFNQPLDEWNVSNVTNMAEMFEDTYVFNQSLNSWNVGNVTNMSRMFFRALAFNGEIGAWNVGNVTTMLLMFNDTPTFNQDISDWNVSNVTDFRSFMEEKTYNITYLSNIYKKWSLLPVQPNINITFGNSNYGPLGDAGRLALLTAPNNWTISDGGRIPPIILPQSVPVPISTANLELWLDASNSTSYPGFGSDWYDISGNGNNARLINGPTFVNGAIAFDGGNDYATYQYDAAPAMTIITIAKYNNTNGSWNEFAGLGSSRSNNGFILHNDWNSKDTRYFIMTSTGAATFVDYVYPTSIGVMRAYAVSTNGSNSHKRYLDGTLVGTNTTSVTRGSSTNTASLGADTGPFASRYNRIAIKAHIIYNRQLTDAEVAQIASHYLN